MIKQSPEFNINVAKCQVTSDCRQFKNKIFAQRFCSALAINVSSTLFASAPEI